MWDMQLGPRKAMLEGVGVGVGLGVGLGLGAAGAGVGGVGVGGVDSSSDFEAGGLVLGFSTHYDDGGTGKGKKRISSANTSSSVENANNSSSSSSSSYDGNIIINSGKPSNSFNLELGAINNV